MQTLKLLILFIIVSSEQANGFVRRDVSQIELNPVDSFQKNLDQFRICVDKSLAMAVGDVNEKQLQPIFNILGEQINRFSKAFDALTAPMASKVEKS